MVRLAKKNTLTSAVRSLEPQTDIAKNATSAAKEKDADKHTCVFPTL
ncbi:MAG: hypothetical protein QXT84_05840 [Candidatus Bathyarchaeia archaeon]